MESERERIERLEAEGKISAEEAGKLKDALARAEAKETAADEHPVTKPRLSRLALAGFLCSPAALILYIGLAAIGDAADIQAIAFWALPLSLSAVAFLTGMGLSVAGLVVTRRSPDRLRGRNLARAGLLLPILLPLLLAFATRAFFAAPPRPVPPTPGSAASPGN